MWSRALESIKKSRAPKKRKLWEHAQTREGQWWTNLAREGYAGKEPGEFISTDQRESMLRTLERLKKPLEYWQDKTVVEFGSGPAGMVEFIDAKKKIAVEPLYNTYAKNFPHLQRSKVEYHAVPAEGPLEIPSEIADLVICYNVLDHVFEPQKVLGEVFRICKTGGEFLFQVYVYKNEDEMSKKSGLHAELHPCSFTQESAIKLLEKTGFRIKTEDCAKEPYHENEYFFICVCEK